MSAPLPRIVDFTLPFPPSVNHYYRNVRGRTLISAAGRAYRKRVGQAVFVQRAQYGFECPLRVTYLVARPDRRKRDLSNLLKAMEDAMEHALVFRDDSQIVAFSMEWSPDKYEPDTAVTVIIETLEDTANVE